MTSLRSIHHSLFNTLPKQMHCIGASSRTKISQALVSLLLLSREGARIYKLRNCCHFKEKKREFFLLLFINQNFCLDRSLSTFIRISLAKIRELSVSAVPEGEIKSITPPIFPSPSLLKSICTLTVCISVFVLGCVS